MKNQALAKIKGTALDEVQKRFVVGSKIGTYDAVVIAVKQVGDIVYLIFEAAARVVASAFGVVSDTYYGKCTLNPKFA